METGVAGIQVVATVDDRFDDRVAASGSQLMSATDLLLTNWAVTSKSLTITGELRAAEPRPGPLVAEGDRVAWGPALTDGAVMTNDALVRAAVPELGEAATRQFRLGFGAGSLDGRNALLQVRRVETRTKAGRVPEPSGPRRRWVVIDLELTSGIFSQDEDITTARWEGTTVVAGRPSSFVLWSPEGTRTVVVEDPTAARSLVPVGSGRWVAGMASGHLVSFGETGTEVNVAAHTGPVIALAYDSSTGALATGGTDGWIFVRRGPSWEPGSDFGTGQPIEALAWAADGALIAKVGGPGGQLLLMRPDRP